MLTPEQIDQLKAPLDGRVVKSRNQGGKDLSYIEAWHAIAEANRIFGFDAWNRETIYCKEVSRTECKVGKDNAPGFKVGYEAKVKITVGEIVREGTGHGSGQMKDLFDCIESAAKEAESDAMKRALMTFGNPFGLALYDKLQRNVEDLSSKNDDLATEAQRNAIMALYKKLTKEQQDNFNTRTGGEIGRAHV